MDSLEVLLGTSHRTNTRLKGVQPPSIRIDLIFQPEIYREKTRKNEKRIEQKNNQSIRNEEIKLIKPIVQPQKFKNRRNQNQTVCDTTHPRNPRNIANHLPPISSLKITRKQQNWMTLICMIPETKTISTAEHALIENSHDINKIQMQKIPTEMAEEASNPSSKSPLKLLGGQGYRV